MNLETLTTMATDAVAQWAPKVVAALAVLLIGWMLAAWAKRLLRAALKKTAVDPVLIPFAAGVTYVGLIVMVVITAVSTLGVPASSFVAVVGAAGLAIALAFQGTFSNFAAGVMLLTFRPFKLSDFVEVAGQSGTVKEIGVFSTMLATPDNIQIRVPNSNVFGNILKNYSANDTRRIDLVVGVGYSDDLATAIRTCRDVLAADDRVLADPEPVVAVHEMADSSVNLVVRPWVSTPDYWAARWDLTRALKEQVEAAGCSIPFPQRDVHLFQSAG